MMKKRLLFFTLTLVALCVGALAVGGDIADPFLSLSYLNSVFTPQVEDLVAEKLDDADQALLASVDTKLQSVQAVTATAPTWQELSLNGQDALSLPTGSSLQVLSGNVYIAFESGCVVNVTTGTEVPSGTMLTANQRYMVAEDTLATCTVTSKTAVVNHQGDYGVVEGSGTDYIAMAEGLKTLSLFQGSFTGYGNGFDLQVAPSRVQALIMFIRVLGEESQALAYTGTTPFSDIASGSLNEKYVGYAYEMGYTNGYSATEFRPDQATSVLQYTEFLLRAMGYRDAATSDLTTTMTQAQEIGLLSATQAAAMESQFLRADLVYTSCQALATPVASGEMLAQVLIGQGIFTAQQYESVQSHFSA